MDPLYWTYRLFGAKRALTHTCFTLTEIVMPFWLWTVNIVFWEPGIIDWGGIGQYDTVKGLKQKLLLYESLKKLMLINSLLTWNFCESQLCLEFANGFYKYFTVRPMACTLRKKAVNCIWYCSEAVNTTEPQIYGCYTAGIFLILFEVMQKTTSIIDYYD